MTTIPVQSSLGPLTYASINLDAIRHNFLQILSLAQEQSDQRLVKSIDIIPVIKSQAYGHGILPVAKTLAASGAHWFAVSNPNEAIKLREAGMISQRILLLESTLSSQAELIVHYDLTPTLCTLELADALELHASQNHKKIPVHIKVDTGMSRFGIPMEEGVSFVKKILSYDHLDVQGLYTHFPMADSDIEFTKAQISMMNDLLKKLQEEHISIPYVHAANSMGLIGYPNYTFNLARTGIMLYGHYPRQDFYDRLDLKTTMTVHTQIVFIKEVKKGEGISYGYSYIAQNDMTIAVLPIGYADGYFRHMSNKAYVLIDGQYCPVVGRITMDQIMVDISTIPFPKIGMEVVIMGQQDSVQITADDLASWADTIAYEVMCSLGSRLEKFYI